MDTVSVLAERTVPVEVKHIERLGEGVPDRDTTMVKETRGVVDFVALAVARALSEDPRDPVAVDDSDAKGTVGVPPLTDLDVVPEAESVGCSGEVEGERVNEAEVDPPSANVAVGFEVPLLTEVFETAPGIEGDPLWVTEGEVEAVGFNGEEEGDFVERRREREERGESVKDGVGEAESVPPKVALALPVLNALGVLCAL